VLNPLDLPGPAFLVVYTLVALVTLVLLYVVRAAGESGPPPRIDTGDPYLIAYLLNPLTVIVERDGYYPPIERLLGELDRVRMALAGGRARVAA